MGISCARQSYSRRLLVLCGGVGMAALFDPRLAAAQDDEILDEIVVTGSRIARDPNLVGALPVQSVNAEEIQLSGDFEISDIVNDIPALATSTTTQDPSGDQGDTFLGANVLSLRGLGSVRTLVLVNGRRHVGGVQGTSSVDVGSIPLKLVERVDVLTGGASAIYGADAVTGVVNFIMKDDYEGFGVDVSHGVSAKGDSRQTAITVTWGTNFANDRGNIAISVDYRHDDGLKNGDRPGEIYATGGRAANPARRFQIGDIDTTTTPNFAQFYDFDNTGLFDFGLEIPSEANFIAAYNGAFGVDPALTQAELSLIERAANAFPLAFMPRRTIPFTSPYGTIMPGNPFTFAGFDPLTPIDLDSNGNPDCLDSFTGYNSVFGAASFGVVGGCWTIDEDGTYSPVRDGLVAGTFDGFGGDSFDGFYADGFSILVPDDKITVNLFGNYDIDADLSAFGEFKFVIRETEIGSIPNSFWDSLFGAADNPFIPGFLQPLAQQTGGVAITIDPLLFDRVVTRKDETIRAVVGLKGEFLNGWSYELSGNYGRFDSIGYFQNSVIVDRWFAAIDAVIDPASGQPACRVDVDPAAPPQTTPFNIPQYDPGYFSFTPGAGQCVPLNIWAGRAGVSPAAVDWVMRETTGGAVIDQFVLSGFITGDSSRFLDLPAGPVSFAVGAEFRDESSELTFDAWQLGIIPEGAPLPAGTNIAEWSDNTSLIFQPQDTRKNETGNYDVWDVYLEASVPLLADVPGVRELTVDAALRLSDYSTIGQTTTWKSNLIYTPLNTLTLRGSYSEAVRAPNISELFSPEAGRRFFPSDPCDVFILDAIAVDDPELAQQTQDNCVEVFTTIGLDPFDPPTGAYAFVNPLNAPIIGVTSGNRLLTEETAETITAGFVFEPDFLEGFNLTVDYWDISIEDAIQQVNGQDVVDACYIGPSLSQTFCQFTERNDDPNSIFFGGFSFLRTTTVNFAKIESSGYDFAAKYAFDVGAHDFELSVRGTRINKIDFFGNPQDLSDVDPELGEMKRPELAGTISLDWSRGDWLVGWQSQYWGEQLLNFVEIENAEALFGPSVTMDEFWQHDLSGRYLLNDKVMIYGGISNITDKEPFITEFAFPVSARGRFFYLGIDYQM